MSTAGKDGQKRRFVAAAYVGRHDSWFRWCLDDGSVMPTGAEWAEAERICADADAARTRADAERSRAEAEHTRAERLAARLRALGIDPDKDG